MTGETSVIQALVEMADSLVDGFDVVDMLTGLAERCVNHLGVSAAGVMLVSPRGDLRLVASSSETMRGWRHSSCRPRRDRAWTPSAPASGLSTRIW